MHKEQNRIPSNLNEASRHCPLCNKSFAQESSRKRHYYYCRSKLPDTNRSRRRSCAPCVSAKTRCIVLNDTVPGGCIRCRERNTECELAVAARRKEDSGGANAGSILATGYSTGNKSESLASTASLALVSGSRHVTTNALPAHSIGWPSEDVWNADLGDLNILGLENPAFSDQSIDALLYPFGEQPGMVESVTSAATPWDIYCPSLFGHRTFHKPNQIPLVSLAKQILRSYPFMMLQKTAPPPFIHRVQPCWAETEEGPSQQSLITCKGLVQLFKSRTGSNRNLVWKLIKLEQESILANHTEFDKWELLASFQALLVYCLLRLQEVPVDNDGFEAAILTTVNLVFNKLAAAAGGVRQMNFPDDPEITWMDWIFNESRRRTVLVFQILNVLIEMSTEASAYPTCGLVLLPLASSAALWNANNIRDWRAEFEVSFAERKFFGLSQTGGLRKLELNVDCVTLSEAVWEEWKADAGEIGILVMIVGSLL